MLPRQYRISREKDFKNIFDQGKSHYGQNLIVRVLPNHLDYPRFAFVVSSRIAAKAYQRNQNRRQISEIIRLGLGKIKPGYDIVIIAKKPLISKRYQEKAQILLNAMAAINLWKK